MTTKMSEQSGVNRTLWWRGWATRSGRQVQARCSGLLCISPLKRCLCQNMPKSEKPPASFFSLECKLCFSIRCKMWDIDDFLGTVDCFGILSYRVSPDLCDPLSVPPGTRLGASDHEHSPSLRYEIWGSDDIMYHQNKLWAWDNPFAVLVAG